MYEDYTNNFWGCRKNNSVPAKDFLACSRMLHRIELFYFLFFWFLVFNFFGGPNFFHFFSQTPKFSQFRILDF